MNKRSVLLVHRRCCKKKVITFVLIRIPSPFVNQEIIVDIGSLTDYEGPTMSQSIWLVGTRHTYHPESWWRGLLLCLPNLLQWLNVVLLYSVLTSRSQVTRVCVSSHSCLSPDLPENDSHWKRDALHSMKWKEGSLSIPALRLTSTKEQRNNIGNGGSSLSKMFLIILRQQVVAVSVLTIIRVECSRVNRSSTLSSF